MEKQQEKAVSRRRLGDAVYRSALRETARDAPGDSQSPEKRCRGIHTHGWLQRNDCFYAFESWVSCKRGIPISLPLELILNPEVCLQN